MRAALRLTDAYKGAILPETAPYRMRIIEIDQLSDPSCDDMVFKMVLQPLLGDELQAFIAGQFVKLGLPGVKDPAPSYFAIASAPEEADSYEFVIKRTQGLSDHLSKMQPGDELEVEGPMGKGFDLSGFKGSDIYLIGVGTGIAPLRSLWNSILRHRKEFGQVHIYAGFLTEMHRLLTDELDALAAQGIDVSITLEHQHEGWEGPIGYVQNALSKDKPSGDNAVACLAGMSAMVDACTETLQNLGFDDSRILLNF